MDLVWTCKCCGTQFSTLPFAYAFNEPDRWRAIPDPERERRGHLNSDTCVIDGKEFYVRTRLIIPLIDAKEPFIWGVWISIAKRNFDRITELWDVEQREQEPMMFGHLSNEISIYPSTHNLKCSLRLKNAGMRPVAELEPTDHPLSVEQRNGITVERVKEIAVMSLGHSR
jgi:hypothetical protein